MKSVLISFNKAAKTSNEVTVLRVLRNPKSLNINVQDAEGNTALHYAIMNSNARITKALVAARAVFLVPDKEGKSIMGLSRTNPELNKIIKNHIEKNRSNSPIYNVLERIGLRS